MDGLTLDPPIVPPIRNKKGKAEQVDQELIDRPSIGSASSISCRRIPILPIAAIEKEERNEDDGSYWIGIQGTGNAFLTG